MSALIRPLVLIAALLVALSACGPRPAPGSLAPEGGYPPTEVDTRELVPEIAALTAERTAGGLILRAVGRTPTPGYWNPDLVNTTPDDAEGTITFEFRVRPPPEGAGADTAGPRRIEAAAFLSNARLRDTSRIEVVGAGTARAITR